MGFKVSALWSTVGKKLLMSVTGLAMIAFLIGHLWGNFLLFFDEPGAFNAYSHFLLGLGGLLILAEIMLVVFFVTHIVAAFAVVWNNRTARSQGYSKYRSAGPPSKKSVASSTMIWTGIVLLVFTVLHVYTFKYGPGIAEGYSTFVDGEEMRDLYRLVVEVFQNPLYVLWYVFAMVFLGFHLRHGFWSAFQSLGANHPRYSPLIFAVGYFCAVVLALGFLAIPVWIYFRGVA